MITPQFSKTFGEMITSFYWNDSYHSGRPSEEE